MKGMEGKKMLKLKHTRKTYYLGIVDEQSIETIKARYGCSTDSDCVRLALRLVAESAVAQLPKKKGK
jgi:hypothetical protein